MDESMDFLGDAGASKALWEARDILVGLTPLKTDCGRLCDFACCQSDESGDNGMALFPLEEEWIGEACEAFPFRLLPEESLFSGGKRLVCHGHCQRERRPLGCMIFPLRIRVEEDGTSPQGFRAKAEIDPRARMVCPLPEMGGLRAMDSRFVEAVEKAGNVLLQNPLLHDALLQEQRMLEEAFRLF